METHGYSIPRCTPQRREAICQRLCPGNPATPQPRNPDNPASDLLIRLTGRLGSLTICALPRSESRDVDGTDHVAHDTRSTTGARRRWVGPTPGVLVDAKPPYSARLGRSDQAALQDRAGQLVQAETPPVGSCCAAGAARRCPPPVVLPCRRGRVGPKLPAEAGGVCGFGGGTSRSTRWPPIGGASLAGLGRADRAAGRARGVGAGARAGSASRRG